METAQVKPGDAEVALQFVRDGGRLLVVSYTKPIILNAKCVAKWDAFGGKPFITNEGNGFRMRSGRSSVYLFPGQLRYI